MRLRRNPPSNSRGLPPALRAETAPECAVSPHDPLEKMRSKWTLSPKSAGTRRARRDEDPWSGPCFLTSSAPPTGTLEQWLASFQSKYRLGHPENCSFS